MDSWSKSYLNPCISTLNLNKVLLSRLSFGLYFWKHSESSTIHSIGKSANNVLTEILPIAKQCPTVGVEFATFASWSSCKPSKRISEEITCLQNNWFVKNSKLYTLFWFILEGHWKSVVGKHFWTVLASLNQCPHVYDKKETKQEPLFLNKTNLFNFSDFYKTLILIRL